MAGPQSLVPTHLLTDLTDLTAFAHLLTARTDLVDSLTTFTDRILYSFTDHCMSPADWLIYLLTTQACSLKLGSCGGGRVTL